MKRGRAREGERVGGRWGLVGGDGTETGICSKRRAAKGRGGRKERRREELGETMGKGREGR